MKLSENNIFSKRFQKEQSQEINEFKVIPEPNLQAESPEFKAKTQSAFMHFTYSILLLIAAGLLLPNQGNAQNGSYGDVTLSGQNNVINTYSSLHADAASGQNFIQVTSAADLDNLQAGDLLMIIQMQGASISSDNDETYGEITDYNNAGNHELVYVNDVQAQAGYDQINLCSTLTFDYTAAGHVQVIKVPQYSSLSLPSGSSVTAPFWNGSTGGVVVIHADGDVFLNGDVNVDGLGFRGGIRDNSSYFSTSISGVYEGSNANDGGEKGESIAGYATEYDALGGRYGRGAPANGGGGGCTHNSAGGGGANASNGNTWNGQGVMSVDDANWLQAWQLDPGYVLAGNQLSNSSGGGRGGYSYGASNRDALTEAPGNSVWSGNHRQANGGWGGRPLAHSDQRIFFGGGGGAGDGNNNASESGANGGGIVIIIADRILGAGTVSANGADAMSTRNGGNDSPGGGGAGGSIKLIANSYGTQSLQANGGQGGYQFINSNESEGPGGGGGGGFISANGNNLTKSVNGGEGGRSDSDSVTEFTPNGATAGGSGSSATVLGITENAFECVGPIAIADYSSGTGDIFVDVAANDIDDVGFDPASITITNAPSDGAISIDNTTGVVTYTPDNGFSGYDTFSYTIEDTDGTVSNEAEVTVLVPFSCPSGQSVDYTDAYATTAIDNTGVADPNNAVGVPDNSFADFYEDSDVFTLDFGQVLASGTSVRITWRERSSQIGTATMRVEESEDNSSFVQNQFMPSTNSTNSVETELSTSVPMRYMRISMASDVSDTDWELDAVTYLEPTCASNISPIANDDLVYVDQDQSITIDVPANDEDTDLDLSSVDTSGLLQPTMGTIEVNALTGNIEYTPNNGAQGVDTFEYSICDDSGVCDVATVTVNVCGNLVASNNSAGTLVSNNGVSNQNEILGDIDDVFALFDDNNDQLTIQLSESIVAGQAYYIRWKKQDEAGVATLNIEESADGVTWTDNDFFEPSTTNQDGVTSTIFAVSDMEYVRISQFSSVTDADFDVDAVFAIANDCMVDTEPAANDDYFVVTENTDVILTVANNDTDPQGNLDLTSVQITSLPDNGGAVSVNNDGTVNYSPADGFFGTEIFIYTICDGENPAECDDAVVVV
ncbi:MAG: Ig-like domain-containing protein, partial [Flavobacteriales bacterium]|nr:Ig-like domain-containing protein [Flavobacteriales bacterium]